MINLTKLIASKEVIEERFESFNHGEMPDNQIKHRLIQSFKAHHYFPGKPSNQEEINYIDVVKRWLNLEITTRSN